MDNYGVPGWYYEQIEEEEILHEVADRMAEEKLQEVQERLPGLWAELAAALDKGEMQQARIISGTIYEIVDELADFDADAAAYAAFTKAQSEWEPEEA